MASEKESQRLSDNFMFPKLFGAFRMAVQPGKLLVALMGLMTICLAGYVMDFSSTVVVAGSEKDSLSELDVYMASQAPIEAVEEFRRENLETGSGAGVFGTLWEFGSGRFHSALRNLFELNFASMAENVVDYFRGVGWAVRFHYGYCLIFAAIKLAVFSILGGAVCRMAALQFARGERTGMIEAIGFGCRRFGSFFFAPLLPAIGIGILAGAILALGLLARIPYAGGLIMALLMGLILVLGAISAAALIGAVAGFNLMFPAVAYDGADAFDAVSRSFSYVFSRPWRMGFYTLIVTVHGAICYMLVRLFAFLLLTITHSLLCVAAGSGGSGEVLSWGKPEFMNLMGTCSTPPAGPVESLAAGIMYLALWIVAGLVVSVVINYYFSANVVIYALMRNKVDNATLDEVHQDDEESGIGSPASLG